jgi:hypothetical protein
MSKIKEMNSTHVVFSFKDAKEFLLRLARAGKDKPTGVLGDALCMFTEKDCTIQTDAVSVEQELVIVPLREILPVLDHLKASATPKA